MSVKEKLIEVFEEHRGTSISGQSIADELGVSRAAVWKAVNELTREGHLIDGTPNKGYVLREESDVLTQSAVRRRLTYLKERRIIVKGVTGSTVNDGVELAQTGAEAGTLIVADEQVCGRGRCAGRSFFSPKHGIYMTLLLRPRAGLDNALAITPAAAVAVAETIDELSPHKADIKWVNDVYVEGKKVCGILSQAVTNLESGLIECVVVGIGINYCGKSDDFPEELRDKARMVFEDEEPTATRARIIARVADKLWEFTALNRQFMEEYKRRSIVLGKDVEYTYDGRLCRGTAKDIDERGGLVVDECGVERTLNCGEVSIRSKNNEWR